MVDAFESALQSRLDQPYGLAGVLNLKKRPFAELFGIVHGRNPLELRRMHLGLFLIVLLSGNLDDEVERWARASTVEPHNEIGYVPAGPPPIVVRDGKIQSLVFYVARDFVHFFEALLYLAFPVAVLDYVAHVRLRGFGDALGSGEVDVFRGSGLVVVRQDWEELLGRYVPNNGPLYVGDGLGLVF